MFYSSITKFSASVTYDIAKLYAQQMRRDYQLFRGILRPLQSFGHRHPNKLIKLRIII